MTPPLLSLGCFTSLAIIMILCPICWRPPPVRVPASMIQPLLAQPRPGPQPVQLHQPREQLLVQAGLGPAQAQPRLLLLSIVSLLT